MPPIGGLADVDYLTSSSMMDVDFLPEHLIVVGGSYIGLEFAQMYRRFGSRVTVVEMAPRLIPREDEEVSQAVREILEAEGIGVRLNARCLDVEKRAGGVAVRVSCEEEPRTIVGSHLLLAVGRLPNTDDLGVDRAGIATDARGFIVVDDELATNVAGVWALGDVNGRGAFTHTSFNDYEIVAANLLDKEARRVSDRFPVYALFTDPPLARAGMTEREARASGRPVLVGRRTMARVGRARERGETQGIHAGPGRRRDPEDSRRRAPRHRSGRGDPLHHRRDERRRTLHDDTPRRAYPSDGLRAHSDAPRRALAAAVNPEKRMPPQVRPEGRNAQCAQDRRPFEAPEKRADANAGALTHGRRTPNRASCLHIMCSSFFISAGNRSTEMSTTGDVPVFCHQCCVPFFSGATSPALCMIGAAQLLAYSTTSPETM